MDSHQIMDQNSRGTNMLDDDHCIVESMACGVIPSIKNS
jgi:hypothetical protein